MLMILWSNTKEHTLTYSSHLSELLHFTVRQLLWIDVVSDHPNSDPMHFSGILEEESKSYNDMQRNSEQMGPNEYSTKHCTTLLFKNSIRVCTYLTHKFTFKMSVCCCCCCFFSAVENLTIRNNGTDSNLTSYKCGIEDVESREASLKKSLVLFICPFQPWRDALAEAVPRFRRRILPH